MNKLAIEWLKRWLDQNIKPVDLGVDYIRAIELSDKSGLPRTEGVAIEDVTQKQYSNVSSSMPR